jgi:co-chaperonin GroES (HSP10)
MKPIRRRILAEILEPKPTKGGLILQGANLEKNQAKVLMIGPMVEFVKVGDTIRFNPNVAQPYEHENKKCVFLNEEGDLLVI